MKLQPTYEVTLLLSKIIIDYESKNKKCTCITAKSLDDFLSQELPIVDIQKIHGEFCPVATNSNKYLRAATKLLNADVSSNAILYSPQSVMGWHTNSDMVGKRVYYTYTKGTAAFMYINDKGERVVDYDNIGWTCRAFDIKGPDKPFWHTIWTQEKRYAFGFWIK